VRLEIPSRASDSGIFTVETLICVYVCMCESFNLRDYSAGTSDTRVNVLLQLWLQ
jgi:hypothetical protein